MRSLHGLTLGSLMMLGFGCGGVAANGEHRAPLDGSGGAVGVDAGSGGFTPRPFGTGGAVRTSTGGAISSLDPAAGGVTTGAGASTGTGGLFFPVDASADAFGGRCASQFPGVDFTNPIGSATCPDVGSLAFWVYGDTIPQPCDRITGPAVASPVGIGWHCTYKYDEIRCGDGDTYTSDWAFDIPYFGPGGPKAPLPTTQVVDIASFCGGTRVPRAPAPDAGPPVAEEANSTIGVWLRCSGADPFIGDGLTFYADGSFQNVSRSADGHIEAVNGCDSEGLWGYLLDYPQMNLYRAHGGEYIHPTFADGPRRHMTFSTELGSTIDLALAE